MHDGKLMYIVIPFFEGGICNVDFVITHHCFCPNGELLILSPNFSQYLSSFLLVKVLSALHIHILRVHESMWQNLDHFIA